MLKSLFIAALPLVVFSTSASAEILSKAEQSANANYQLQNIRDIHASNTRPASIPTGISRLASGGASPAVLAFRQRQAAGFTPPPSEELSKESSTFEIFNLARPRVQEARTLAATSALTVANAARIHRETTGTAQ